MTYKNRNDPEVKRKESEYKKKWYQRNKERVIANNRKNTLRYREEVYNYIRQYREQHPCKCGESHPSCLDFHHESGEKEFNISVAIEKGYSLIRVKAEIEKCEILCSNCHRKLHYNERFDK